MTHILTYMHVKCCICVYYTMQYTIVYMYTIHAQYIQNDTASTIFGKMLKRPGRKAEEVRSQAFQTKYKKIKHEKLIFFLLKRRKLCIIVSHSWVWSGQIYITPSPRSYSPKIASPQLASMQYSTISKAPHQTVYFVQHYCDMKK